MLCTAAVIAPNLHKQSAAIIKTFDHNIFNNLRFIVLSLYALCD